MKLALIFSIIFSNLLFASSLSWNKGFSEELLNNLESNQYVLVDFMFERCGPCIQLERSVFNTEVFEEFVSDLNLELVKLDVTKLKYPGHEIDQWLSDSFTNVRSTPSLIVVNKKIFEDEDYLSKISQEVDIVSGLYIQPEPVIRKLKDQIDLLESLK